MVNKKLIPETLLPDCPDTCRDVIKTPRLTIRRLTLADAAFIYDLVNQPSWLKFIGDKGINNLQDAQTYIQSIFELYQKYGFGLYRVEISANAESIGICGLVKRESLQDFDIGFALLSQHEGNGYALESASAILRLAKDTFKLSRIAAICTPDNHSSIKLIEKLGFQLESSTSLDTNGKSLKLFTVTLG
jgi:RimJ/RimL family protein N-acetyltransferase